MNLSETCDCWVLGDISLGQNAAYLNTAENESAMCDRDEFFFFFEALLNVFSFS